MLSIDAELLNPISHDPILIQVLQAEIKLVDRNNPTGPIKGETLTVSGQLHSASLQISSKSRTGERAKYFLTDSGSDSKEQKCLVSVRFDEAAVRAKEVFYCHFQS